jgi:hypothetical protein
MTWLIGFLAIGAVAAGHALDKDRHLARRRVPRPEINRWEEEGGAVPVTPQRTAAQTASPAAAAPKGATKRTNN